MVEIFGCMVYNSPVKRKNKKKESFMSLIKQVFDTNLADYENFGIVGDFYINYLLLGIYFGIVAVGYVLCFFNINLNTVVRQLIRHSAFSPDTACSLKDLGLADSFGAKIVLGGSGQLRRVVGRIGESGVGYDEYMSMSKEQRQSGDKIDFETEKFYIRESGKERAQLIADKYRTSWFNTTLFMVLLFIVVGTVMALMPDILNFVNDSILGAK